MAFALCPDNGPPRLWRFVERGVLPPAVLCTLDAKQNILTIDRKAFDQLSDLDRLQVLKTHRSVIAYVEAA